VFLDDRQTEYYCADRTEHNNAEISEQAPHAMQYPHGVPTSQRRVERLGGPTV